MSNSLKLVAFMGSVRNGRNADRVCAFIKKAAEVRGHSVEVVDPLTVGFGQLANPIHFFPDQSAAPEGLKKLNEVVKAADGYILISAEYNRAVPPALINLLDHLPPRSYAFKSSCIVSYSLGPGAGMVMIPQLRAFLCELGMPPVPFSLTIGQVNQKLNESGVPLGDFEAIGATKAGKLFDQLEWYAGALKDKRAKEGGDLKWEGTMVS